MNRNSMFFRQARLMLQMIPAVEKETCFALKGGTAINFFLRDMPRLSVDIDLVYLPIESREDTLKNISHALTRIASTIRRTHKRCRIQELKASDDRIVKLVVRDGDTQIKIEPNEILRGSVFPPVVLSVSATVEATFEAAASMQVLSAPDLYGGKICALLDRQHPRDMFDVKTLLAAEGLTEDIRQAFVVYLASHHRPMHELLTPKLKDMQPVYDREFVGMTTEAVRYEDLSTAREQCIAELHAGMTAKERDFLISIKERKPDWSLLGIEGLDKLPSIQWKLANLAKMSADKHAAALHKLKNSLR